MKRRFVLGLALVGVACGNSTDAGGDRDGGGGYSSGLASSSGASSTGASSTGGPSWSGTGSSGGSSGVSSSGAAPSSSGGDASSGRGDASSEDGSSGIGIASGGSPSGAPACASVPRARAEMVVAMMTLAEKVQQMHGVGGNSPNIRVVPAIARLGIPAFVVTNGPDGATNGSVKPVPPATAMPCALALAATWDIALARAYGEVVGNEAKVLGNSLLEGPDMNLARIPQGGRTFENLGEDPFLAGKMAAADIQGIQSQGEIGEAKHFLNNEQEANRNSMNAIVDVRSERELYLAPFEASVKEGCVGAIMCGYPQVNGTFSCENGTILNSILKTEWAFSGVVTSDFGAVHSTVPSATNGLDLEMPSGKYFDTALIAAVNSGMVPQAALDEHLVRRYAVTMALGLWDSPPVAEPISTAQQTADGVEARQIAAAGIVLLKNAGGILPLNPAKVHKIALIGPASSTAKTGGGGSSAVVPLYTVAPEAGLKAQAGAGATITIDDGSNVAAALAAAKAADVAVVMVGDSRAEGSDTPIALSGNQDALVTAIAAANANTIVVLKTGSVALMPWVAQVPAILEAWYPGEEDGDAVADVLYGAVNPSGKLPLTFPVAIGDLPANTPGQYPSGSVVGIAQAHYSEGLLMGYRAYDAHAVAPLFPFGFGLSYTTFAYANLAVTPAGSGGAMVDFDVTNSGARDGAEVVQVYVGMPAAAGEPPKQLKGFAKLVLAAGKTSHATVALDARAFQYWDTATDAWVTAPGTYGIFVGSSSRDVKLYSTITR
jgi:beta-glucosidase